MLTNELKKGARVQLRNGWYATVFDNAKGQTRLCEVEGICTEIGSVYSHDIVLFYPTSGSAVKVEHTEKQMNLREQVAMLGF